MFSTRCDSSPRARRLRLNWRLLLIAAAGLACLGVANPVRAQSADELTAEAAKLYQAGTAGSLNDLGTVYLLLGRC